VLNRLAPPMADAIVAREIGELDRGILGT